MDKTTTTAQGLSFTQPVRQIVLMLLVVGLVLVGGWLVKPQVEDVFRANIWLNGAIGVVFVFGVLACVWQVVQLIYSVSWIEGFTSGRPGFDPASAPRLLAPLAALLAGRQSRLQISSSSQRSILDSVAARIDEARDITRYIVNLLILMGLLGTFYGLATTVPAVVDTIRNLSPREGETALQVFDKLMGGLEAQLGGMGTAFSSSLLGLAGSLVVGLLELFAGHGQNRFFRELEEWLSTITRIGLAAGEGEGGADDVGAMAAALSDYAHRIDTQMEALIGLAARTEAARAALDERILRLAGSVERLAQRIDDDRGEQEDVVTLLERIATGQEALAAHFAEIPEAGGVDAESRMRLRSIDVQMLRILEEISAGRQESMADLRADLGALMAAVRQLGRGQGCASMALSRRMGGRIAGNSWPGFVDAMTALLLVLMFVLSIFMIVQSVLRDTITSQDSELSAQSAEIAAQYRALDTLSGQVAELADALGLERSRTEGLQAEVGRLTAGLAEARSTGAEQAELIGTLSASLAAREADLAAAGGRIADFEAQVASLLADRDRLTDEGTRLSATVEELDAARAALVSEQDALNLALAAARSEVDAGAEAARLAAARADAMEALVADLRGRVSEGEDTLAQALARLSDAEGEGVALTQRVAALTEAEARATAERDGLRAAVGGLTDELARVMASAGAEADALRARLAGVEADLSEAERARLAEAAALLAARDRLAEVEAGLSEAERARLAEAAAAEALRARLVDAEGALTEAEQARLADLAAAEALRARLASSDAELTAMTLALEEQRRRAEETLTLLAAARTEAAQASNTGDARAALLAAAQSALAAERSSGAEAQRQVALLNEQVASLRAQLGALQGLLDAAGARDAEAQVQIEALGGRLNAALAQVAAEERRRADLEAAERRRLEVVNQDLEGFRSEFFGQLREVLAGREGVRVVGDRFVFSSEVLFQVGSADLAPEGRAQIAGVVATLQEIAGAIPPSIDWIIRVDGHTDNVPLSGLGAFADNWSLSQARALSVVRFMQDELGFPPNRMAATGFGEWQPVAEGNSPQARAQNRRIELKLTER